MVDMNEGVQFTTTLSWSANRCPFPDSAWVKGKLLWGAIGLCTVNIVQGGEYGLHFPLIFLIFVPATEVPLPSNPGL